VRNDDTGVALPPRCDRLLVVGCVLVLTVLAWAYLVRLEHDMAESMAHEVMMAGMGMTMDMPWTAIDAVFTFTMWLVMMAGMMAPATAPTLLLFAAAHRARGGGLTPTAFFGLGYLAVWGGFSGLAALAQWALHQAALLSPTMAASSPYLGGGILIAAGAYQLTPMKGACLAHCRSPLGFLMSHWRDGSRGALVMGARHGLYCLGCCWALMCVLFAVGVMNLAWVAALSAVVLVEKVGPGGIRLARAAGVVTMIFGIVVAADR
jgi:predicted metal-binding membrane protein